MKKIIASFIIGIIVSIGICPALNVQASSVGNAVSEKMIMPCCDSSSLVDMEMSCCHQDGDDQQIVLGTYQQEKKQSLAKKSLDHYRFEMTHQVPVFSQWRYAQRDKPKILTRAITHVVRLE